MIKVAPSSNPCDEDKLVSYAKKLEEMGVEYLHCDVMDGKFVENKCLDFDVLQNVRINTNILLDVHLMTENVYENVLKYSKLKPSIITIHYEALKNLMEFNKVKKLLASKQILMGLAISPNTPIEIVSRLLKQVDLVLIMTVIPGKSGQALIEDCLSKIQIARDLIQDDDTLIEVDGGINEENFANIVKLGANFLVMGKAFYSNANQKKLLQKIDKHYK